MVDEERPRNPNAYVDMWFAFEQCMEITFERGKAKAEGYDRAVQVLNDLFSKESSKFLRALEDHIKNMIDPIPETYKKRTRRK